MNPRKRRPYRVALAAVLAAAVQVIGATQSQAAPFNFNPTGGASTPTYTVTGLNFGAGNALAVGSIPLTQGASFQLYVQTNLTSLNVPSGTQTVPGLNSTFQITEVATLNETVASVTPGPSGTTATFALTPGDTAADQIKIYYNPAVTYNDATGKGFTDGTVIATLTPSSFTGSQFTDTTATNGTTAFNTTGAGNMQATTAETGSGSTGIQNMVVSGYNPAFFNPPSGTPQLVSSLFNSNLYSYFDTVSPSLQFTNPITGAVITPNIGSNNGTSGPDFQLELSGVTESFTPAASAVPEPASVAMLGVGLVGVLAFARKKALAV